MNDVRDDGVNRDIRDIHRDYHDEAFDTVRRNYCCVEMPIKRLSTRSARSYGDDVP